MMQSADRPFRAERMHAVTSTWYEFPFFALNFQLLIKYT